MPDLYLLLDLIVIFSLCVLAFSVLTKNRAIRLNRIFAYFVICISVWILANYISNDSSNSERVATTANYFVFGFSYAAVIYLIEFAVALTKDVKATKILHYARVPLWIIAVLSATPLVVAGVTPQEFLYAVTFGPLAPVYFLTLVINVAFVGWVIRRNIKSATGDQRGRLKVLWRSFVATFPVLVLVQAIIPATTGWFGLTNIGILPMLILVFGLYYSVVKHRLFDLRLIVVRTVAYVATLATISVLYGLATHYLLEATANVGVSGISSDMVNVVLIVIAVLTYGPLKKVFDRITNKFFYQDAYDPQEFLNSLNQVLVSTIELKALLHSSSEIIEHDLKSEFCAFSIHATTYQDRRIIGNHGHSLDQNEISEILATTPGVEGKVIVTDYLEENQKSLKKVLAQNQVAVLVRLTSASQPNVEGVGYILLGAKKSGSPFNYQDIRILEIVANELVIAIQNALRFEEISNFNITLQEQIEQATGQLKRTNERLRLLDETKDDFISMASHQLRTPLTSVKGYLSMVLEGDAGKVDKKQAKLLNQAFVSAERMVYLIADLLNVSRLKTGKFVIDTAPVNLADVISGEVGQLIETAQARDLKLSYEKPNDFPTLMLDETKIRQVIMNFIDNAVYYTPAGGHITVKLEETEESVSLKVIDDGIGVPKHEQPHLFTKFYRAGNARKARPDGTGLGLFMAKKVVIAQGGSLIFRSAEGKGSTFGFTFAKAKLKVPEHVEAPAEAAEALAE